MSEATFISEATFTSDGALAARASHIKAQDLAEITPTGKNGQYTGRDVNTFLNRQKERQRLSAKPAELAKAEEKWRQTEGRQAQKDRGGVALTVKLPEFAGKKARELAAKLETAVESAKIEAAKIPALDNDLAAVIAAAEPAAEVVKRRAALAAAEYDQLATELHLRQLLEKVWKAIERDAGQVLKTLERRRDQAEKELEAQLAKLDVYYPGGQAPRSAVARDVQNEMNQLRSKGFFTVQRGNSERRMAKIEKELKNKAATLGSVAEKAEA